MGDFDGDGNEDLFLAQIQRLTSRHEHDQLGTRDEQLRYEQGRVSHLLEVGKAPHFQPEAGGEAVRGALPRRETIGLHRGAQRMIARSAQRHR